MKPMLVNHCLQIYQCRWLAEGAGKFWHGAASMPSLGFRKAEGDLVEARIAACLAAALN